MPFRQSWVTLGQGYVLGWVTTPQPPGAGAAASSLQARLGSAVGTVGAQETG